MTKLESLQAAYDNAEGEARNVLAAAIKAEQKKAKQEQTRVYRYTQGYGDTRKTHELRVGDKRYTEHSRATHDYGFVSITERTVMAISPNEQRYSWETFNGKPDYQSYYPGDHVEREQAIEAARFDLLQQRAAAEKSILCCDMLLEKLDANNFDDNARIDIHVREIEAAYERRLLASALDSTRVTA